MHKYRNLHMLSILGSLQSTLEEVAHHCQDSQLEFASPRCETGREFLAGFHYPPAIDVTLIRTFDGAASIEARSFDRKKSQELLDLMIERTAFVARPPTAEFIADINVSIPIIRVTYGDIEKIARMLSVSNDAAAGIVWYSNFLICYKGASFEESKEIVRQRFGLVGKL